MAARMFIKSLLALILLYLARDVTNQVARATPEARSWASDSSSEIKQQQDQDESYLEVGEDTQGASPKSRFKTTIGSLLQVGHTNRRVAGSISGNNQGTMKLLRSAASQVLSQSAPLSGVSSSPVIQNSIDTNEYKCANYCSCSVIQVMDKSNEKKANLTQAHCESPLFTDLLTIDRRTHIIYISLPNKDDDDDASKIDSSAGPNGVDVGFRKPVADSTTSGQRQFRMPRLSQFNLLKEIVIINLRFEVCDSEVFKKGQKLRRLQLNHNRLKRISKACLKHLHKLVELNLDHNRLDELESALFNSLLNLKSLSIAYNQLTELAAHQFANLTNLVSLNLVGNSFKSINLQLFEPMQSSLRLLLLAKNQIKSFIQQQAPPPPTTITTSNQTASTNRLSNGNLKASSLSGASGLAPTKANASPFMGVVFKNLIKLNVDENKFERIKLLQLHRFFNVKYLSIRKNNITTIRDKAFNGLKLVELNLAHNQLQTVWKCAFCNATIKRLVLSYNNISLPQLAGNDALASLAAASPIVPRPLALNGSIMFEQASVINTPAQLPIPLAQTQTVDQQSSTANSVAASVNQAVSSPNMLILSQSIFGPLFGQLEYLDLSNNQLLADRLELLLEPLLKLEYLNLASTGLDRYLPSPSLFKNLRQLRYLNLSHNQLDQVVAETVEPLAMLEVLDLSHNKFSELDESFLVTVDDMSGLKVINFGSNPWFCSQCKVAPLYDWILRSPIYNLTCIAPSMALTEERREMPGDEIRSDEGETQPTGGDSPEVSLTGQAGLARGPQHYGLLVGNDDEKPADTIDLDLVLGGSSLDEDFAGHYNMLASDYLYNGAGNSAPAGSLREGLASGEDDPSIGLTMQQVSGALKRRYLPEEFCLKCEFPGELRSLNIHELQANDFKFCAGAAPRFSASEPKIGLTLAIVIIGALFCIIIIVIVMYRKKSNTYYTNEDTDQLDGGSGAMGGKKPVFSISSDAEHRYGDNTDYSSPPMSQSYDSYSQDDDDDDEEDEEVEDEDELDEDGDYDEDEEGDEDAMDEEDENVAVGDIDEEPAKTVPTQPMNHHDLQHVERGKHKMDDHHNHHHHVGYASDLEAPKQPGAGSNSDIQQVQAAANAKRVAAAELERRNQVAEYHKNERHIATTGGSSQRTSHSQGSSLSPADRSASGPVPHGYSSSNKEPTKRQSSAHHHHHQHQHHGSRAKAGATAAVAAATLVSTPPVEKLAQKPNKENQPNSHSNTPSLGPSSGGQAQGSSKRNGAGHSSGGHSSSSPVATAAACARTTTRTPAKPTIGSFRQPTSESQSNQSNASSDLGARLASAVAKSGGSRSTLPSNESLVGGSKSQQQQHLSNHEAPSAVTSRQLSPAAKQVNPPLSGRESLELTLSEDLRRQKSVKGPQATGEHRGSKSRPHSSGAQQHVAVHRPPEQQSSMGASTRRALEPGEPPATGPKPVGAPATGTGSRLGRQRFAVSKEQKSQPAMEWAHLRPVVEPPAAPLSLGVVEQQQEQHSLGLQPAETLGNGPELTAHSDQLPRTGPSQQQPLSQSKAAERRHSPTASDATTADSLALEALSYTASELEEPPVEVGGALEMDSSGSFGPDEFVNNNNITSNNIAGDRHRHQQSARLQTGGYPMRGSHSSHSALTQTGSRDEMM